MSILILIGMVRLDTKKGILIGELYPEGFVSVMARVSKVVTYCGVRDGGT